MFDYASSKYKYESMDKFKDLFIKIVHAMVEKTSQSDVTVQDIKNEVNNNKNILKKFVSKFSRKV